MKPAVATAGADVPHIRITTDATRRVTCAGRDWAGISELPASDFTAADLVALKADKRLEVEEINRPLAA